MKITKRQLRRIIKEYNDQDYQNVVDDIVAKFYDKAEDFETYVDLSVEELSRQEMEVVFNFNPPEFADVRMMDSSGMLILSPELQQDVEAWLLNNPEPTVMREAWMVSVQGFAPLKSRVDPEFAALIKGIVTEVVEDEEDDTEDVNPFGTGNRPVHDPDMEEDLISHT